MDATEKAKPQTVRVSIFNQTYTVLTADNPEETVQLADEVDNLMGQISRRTGNLDATRTAVLACLHLADKLKHAEKQLSTLRASLTTRTRNIAELLDQVAEDR